MGGAPLRLHGTEVDVAGHQRPMQHPARNTNHHLPAHPTSQVLPQHRRTQLGPQRLGRALLVLQAKLRGKLALELLEQPTKAV